LGLLARRLSLDERHGGVGVAVEGSGGAHTIDLSPANVALGVCGIVVVVPVSRLNAWTRPGGAALTSSGVISWGYIWALDSIGGALTVHFIETSEIVIGWYLTQSPAANAIWETTVIGNSCVDVTLSLVGNNCEKDIKKRQHFFG